MKCKLKCLYPNPYKKLINGGKLNQKQIDRLKASISELGHMGSIPIVKIEGKKHLISHHHRVEALRQLHGDDFEVFVEEEKYSDEQMFRGMIVENLLQRNGEFQEEVLNIKAIKEYLIENEILLDENGKILSNSDSISKTKPFEYGSRPQIIRWLNKNGEIMSEGKVFGLLQVAENLDEEILNSVESTHRGDASRRGEVVSRGQAEYLSRFKDKDEQKDLAKALLKSREGRVREQSTLLSKYKDAPDEIKQKVRNGKIDLADVEDESFKDMLKQEAKERPKWIFVPDFNQRMRELNENIEKLEQHIQVFSELFHKNDFTERYNRLKPKQKQTLNDTIKNIRRRIEECRNEIDFFDKRLRPNEELLEG